MLIIRFVDRKVQLLCLPRTKEHPQNKLSCLIIKCAFGLTLSHFHDNLLQAGIVITGEGKIDIQSFYGKIPGTVATLCLQQNVPVYAVVGLAEKQVLTRFDKVVTMSQYARSIQDSIKNAPYYLKILAQAIVDALYSSAYSD